MTRSAIADGGRASAAAILAGAGLSIAGCVLLVSPQDIGDHCRFQGQETDCGRCLVARCQAEIDACCGAAACDPTLAALDGCATTRDGRCGAVRDARASTEPPVSALGACVASRCAGACAEAPPSSTTSCGEPALSKGTGCSCSLSSAPNTFVCSEVTYPEAVCCAPEGWPSPGGECSCLAIQCTPTSDGCICARADYDLGFPTTCDGAICCAAEDGCYCGTKPCESSQRQVASCSLAEIGCKRGQVRVAACSQP